MQHPTDTEDGRYQIRPMDGHELAIAIDWAADEGWNPGLYDAECFFAADPTGFFIGELDGTPVATISAVAYDNEYGFLGFYIVRPEYRGRGYGLSIWRRALEYLGSRNVGLDGVVDQQDNYRKSGFTLAYRNIRYSGVGAFAPSSAGIFPIRPDILDKVVAYDRKFFPADRTSFLQKWLTQPESWAVAFQADDSLAGYGVIRLCRNGYKIGPLFADNAYIAEDIFRALAGKAAGAEIFLDTPENNPAAVALAESHGMSKVFETARMYSRYEPSVEISGVFGVSTFELG